MQTNTNTAPKLDRVPWEKLREHEMIPHVGTVVDGRSYEIARRRHANAPTEHISVTVFFAKLVAGEEDNGQLALLCRDEVGRFFPFVMAPMK